MTRIATQFPVQPNGVVINYMEVEGGVLDLPQLITSSSGNGTEYSMVVSQFNVTFSVLDCGYDIGLLAGSYDSGEAVAVEQVHTELYNHIIMDMIHV